MTNAEPPVSTARVDHGLTHEQLAALPLGTTLHFTNHPCTASVPAELVSHRGDIRLGDGRELPAFPDELSLEPRAGLGS